MNTIPEADRSLPPRPVRYSRNLSAAIDRAAAQAEVAEETGDASMARAWRRVLRDLERRIPESRR